MISSESASLPFDQVPKWINVLKELGIPTLLGGILGILSSYLLFTFQSKREDKKEKKDTANKIFSEVYSYNVTAGTEVLFNFKFPNATQEEKISNQNRFAQAAKNYNEMEALADLTVGKECAESLERIKTLIPAIQEEFKEKFIKGNPPKNRHETEKGKEYDKELENLKKILKKWISS